jgi:hypothetical protein
MKTILIILSVYVALDILATITFLRKAKKNGITLQELAHIAKNLLNGISPFSNENFQETNACIEKQCEKSEYDPYKTTIESIAEMCEKYASSTDLADFYGNVKAKCREAIDYDKTWNGR